MLLLLLTSSLARTSAARGPEEANCLPGAWLPRGSDVAMCPGMDYDGSLVPDCATLHGPDSNTSFFHVHEYGERVPHQHPSLQIVASSGSGVPRARASWSALPATLTQRPAQTAAFSSIAG